MREMSVGVAFVAERSVSTIFSYVTGFITETTDYGLSVLSLVIWLIS